MANKVLHQKEGGQPSLGGLSVTVDRNYYGRQADSFKHALSFTNEAKNSSLSLPIPTKVPVFFIRAPMILHTTQDVAEVVVLATLPKEARPDKAWPSDPIVAVRQHNFVGLTFHPELTEDLTWHDYFVNIVKSS
jgi:pyridoxal 5'-phosphate synthase pdxT subunit